jgi:hypothetical protein
MGVARGTGRHCRSSEWCEHNWTCSTSAAGAAHATAWWRLPPIPVSWIAADSALFDLDVTIRRAQTNEVTAAVQLALSDDTT